MKRPVFALLLVVVAVSALAACGSKSATTSAAPENTFRLSEYVIAPPGSQLRAGQVELTADNVGSETHELVIVTAASASDLPVKPDGSVDEDKIPAADKVGEIDNIAARSKARKSFQLSSGTYVAFCNIIDTMGSGTMGGMHAGAGHVHFALGMQMTFRVG